MAPIPNDEPLPFDLENRIDEDNDWIDEEEAEKDAGEEVVKHFFSEEDASGRRKNPYSSRIAPDYATRIEKERENWKMQEDELVRAYMEWRVGGAVHEDEGEGMSSFECRVYTLAGTTIISSTIHSI